MGYTTNFNGRVKLDRKLTPEHAAYIRKFSRTRRMKRDAKITATRPDPIREAVGLPVGVEGEFFVGADACAGLEDRSAPGLLEYNTEPSTQPGLWCQWTVSEDDQGIEWDGGEKFYGYTPWLEYYVENFLKPWGYVANGEIHFQGEDREDKGTILCINNKVQRVDVVPTLQTLALQAVGVEWESYNAPEYEVWEDEDEDY